MLPKLFAIWRQQRFGDRDQLLDELFGFLTERKFNSLCSAREIGDDRETTSLYPIEK
jgi:hypothetical protein